MKKTRAKFRNARSIKSRRPCVEYGWQQPIVVDKHGVIVVGHVRRLAALQLGWTEAPVHVADKLTPAQIRAYRLMDNRSHQEADWDLELLAPELAELNALSFDLSLTGFNVHELDVLAAQSAGRGESRPGSATAGSRGDAAGRSVALR